MLAMQPAQAALCLHVYSMRPFSLFVVHAANIRAACWRAAASGDVVGVAPGATLGAYRVFGCTGGTTDDILIEALNQAAADGMQIINLSLGSDYDFVSPTDPIIDVYNNLVRHLLILWRTRRSH